MLEGRLVEKGGGRKGVRVGRKGGSLARSVVYCIPSEGWVGIIYHNGLKNYEHYTPVAVEGIYRDWQKCCDVQARLAAMADEIGFFCRRGVESETYAIAKFQNWKAHAESLKRCDKLLNEPENYEIENFFDAINITEFGAVITQMQFEHNVILTAQLHNSNR